MANLWAKLYKWAGWKTEISVPRLDKCVICVAPHTSNWDFIAGIFAYKSLGRQANFLMKEFWFFWPLKYLLRRLGGIPVPSRRGSGGKGSLTERIIEAFGTHDYMNMAVTPEGTRSCRSDWRHGFLYIAYGAKVPIQLAVIDYRTRTAIIKEQFTPTGDVEADMAYVKNYYAQWKDAAKYPEKFCI